MSEGEDIFLTQNTFQNVEESSSEFEELFALFESEFSTEIIEPKSASPTTINTVSSASDTNPEFQNILPNYRHADPVSFDNLKDISNSSIPASTRSHYNWGHNVFSTWQKERAQRPVLENLDGPAEMLSLDIVDMSPQVTNIALQFFLAEVKKSNGSNYPSQSLNQLFVALQGYITTYANPSINFITDPAFVESRKVLDGLMKRRAAEGLGISFKKSAEPISLNEEDLLWENNLLGGHNGQQLLDTMVYLNGIHFALRGGKEHRQLRLRTTTQIAGPFYDVDCNLKFILYREDVSKNNSGGLKDKKIPPKSVRAYENKENPDRCIVALFEKYKSLCPGDNCDAFYYKPLLTPRVQPLQWFSRVPVGHNTISSTVRRLCSAAGIQGRKTNHSLRATSATRMYHAGVDEQLITEKTGHRSNAVRNYKRTSSEQQASSSAVLYGKRSKVSIPEASVPSVSTVVPSVSVNSSTANGSGSRTISCNFNINLNL